MLLSLSFSENFLENPKYSKVKFSEKNIVLPFFLHLIPLSEFWGAL